MHISSAYPVLCVEDVKETANFYRAHFRFRTVFENDWYVHLTNENQEEINLAIMRWDHDSIPEGHRKNVGGVLINFEVENASELYHQHSNAGLDILQPLRDDPTGQRHYIVRDPAGTLIDIITPIEPSDAFKAQFVS
ncbi:MAG: VOC family protein [Stappiaceae bacterium]